MRHQALALTFPLLLPLLLTGCHRTADFTPLDYAKGDNWYAAESDGAFGTDVFYVLPTCVFARIDEKGDTIFFADTDDEESRARMLPSYQLADEVFGDSCNLFAPYYRQVSMEVWTHDRKFIDSLFATAFVDIAAAFDYYMEHYNHGHPFILAGFSQGGKAVVELCKRLTDSQRKQLVAGYAIGYMATQEDIASCPALREARSATDLGVLICYNSMATSDAMPGFLYDSRFCTNPVNWCADATPAIINDSTTATVDTANKVLIVTGLDPERYFIPQLAQYFPMGNYHLLEITLYKDFLRQNVFDRCRATKTHH